MGQHFNNSRFLNSVRRHIRFNCISSKNMSSATASTEDKLTYLDMTVKAIQALRTRKGASRAAIARWIEINFEKESGSLFNSYLRTAIQKGLQSGVLKEGETAQRFKIGELPKAVKPKKKVASKKKTASKKKSGSKKKKGSSKKKSASKKKTASTKKSSSKKKAGSKKKNETKKKN